MQSPRFKKDTFRERYYFFVLSRAWNKEKILNPHGQWGTKNCFPLSHARDKTRNIFLYRAYTIFPILLQHLIIVKR